MNMHIQILTNLPIEKAKAKHKADDSVCARQVAHLGGKAVVRRLRLKLGTEPAADAATLASALWGRKRQATTLYLFVSHRDLEALNNDVYVERLQKAFGHCTRRLPSVPFTLALVPCDALAVAI